MIQDALKIEGADFKIMASPWTCPPWMKTNNHWNGGELKKEYHQCTFKQTINIYFIYM